MADGHLNKCKDCVKGRIANHREENIERIREYDRKRGNRQGYEYTKEYREKYPNKYKAHNTVNNAIRDKRLDKKTECESCGSDFHVVAHHDDYSKPLEVRWLCQACHTKWHSKNGEALNAS
tara:strand:+ start:9039 stop:9401 length:363 start_codon:yes stop_codon:yes gene_type:complete